MINTEIKPKEEIIEQDATIIFEIPAYKDKDTGQSFKRTIRCPTKKAYAIYKRAVERFTVEKD
jgi:hypothetical protein